MGWTKHKLTKGGVLCTRGGLCGVFVICEKDGSEIHIDEKLLLMLAADEIRNHRIRDAEGATDSELLGFEVEEWKA